MNKKEILKMWKYCLPCLKCKEFYGTDNPKDSGYCPKHDEKFISKNKKEMGLLLKSESKHL